MDLNFYIVVLTTFAISLAQYNENPQRYRQISNYPTKQIAYPSYESSYTSDYKKPVTPSPLILSHKQSLTHDGGFKYAFATDNGLQQGEIISPDGTRQGQYSYVDPSGQTITVKYSAGKEGFRILEGAHVPQPVETQQIKNPGPQQEPTPIRYNSAPQIFSPPNEKYTQVYQHHQPTVPAPIPRYLQYKNVAEDAERRVNENAIQREPEYNDEPGKPHSFGNGYSFEFSG